MIVLDASALLAVLHGEPGSAQVLTHRDEMMMMSSVNYAEALQVVVQQGGTAEDVVRMVKLLDVEIVDFTRLSGWVVAELTRGRVASSLGDRTSLALARETGGTVYTTDASWEQISSDEKVAVRVVR